MIKERHVHLLLAISHSLQSTFSMLQVDVDTKKLHDAYNIAYTTKKAYGTSDDS